MSEDEQQTPPHCPTCQCQVLECIEQILDEASQQLADLEDSPGEGHATKTSSRAGSGSPNYPNAPAPHAWPCTAPSTR